MKIFVTGASGFIGSAVTADLIAAGHSVAGLARSDAAAATIEALGAEVLHGDLKDHESLRKGASESDGVAHLGYNHDFADMEAAAKDDLAVVEVIGEALAGTGKPFAIASGSLALAQGRTPEEPPSTEAQVPSSSFGRLASENAAIELAGKGVRSSVIRLAPTVHGEGDHGFVPRLISIAREKGVAGYVGDGASRWPAVHRLDAARLYRLALEKAPAGSYLHAVGDQGIPYREIAEAIARGAGLEAVSVDPAEAIAHFGFLGVLIQMDNPTSSAATQALVGWTPTHPGLIDDLAAGHYFK